MDSSSHKISLEELIISDLNINHEYEDECLLSTLYFVSLSTSLREIQSLYSQGNQDFAEKKLSENEWLLDKDKTIKSIPIINADLLPNLCSADGMKSVDGLLLNYDEDKLNLIIEFKNCLKDTLLNKYLNPKKESDYLYYKFVDFRNLLSSSLYINQDDEDKHTIIDKTHVIIVYSGKANTVADFYSMTAQKAPSIKNTLGKQKQATRNITTKKTVDKKIDGFSKDFLRLRYSPCKKHYFPIPALPDSHKEKPLGSIRNFTLFSSSDFKKLIESGFFDSVDWGIYKKYIHKDAT